MIKYPQPKRRLKDLDSGLWTSRGMLAINLLRYYKFGKKGIASDSERLFKFIKKRKLKRNQFFNNAFFPHWRREPAYKYIAFRDSFDEALTKLQLYEVAVRLGS